MSIFSNDSRIGESYDRFGDLVIVISFRVGKDVMQFFCKQIFLLFFRALCQMMLVKRNLRIIWTEQKEENLFLFCLFG
ncbi:hypothetical protein FZB85_06355 [Enterococcus faecium]|nr:hypothetical protein [Enterococcus faecium]